MYIIIFLLTYLFKWVEYPPKRRILEIFPYSFKASLSPDRVTCDNELSQQAKNSKIDWMITKKEGLSKLAFTRARVY
jgi:hypothetical protein